MTDNTTVLDGAGASTVFGTDDISSVFYPRVKVVWGPDGTVNDSDVATGKPLPIQIRSATGLIPIGEPTDDANASITTTTATLVGLLKQISKNTQTGYASTYETLDVSTTKVLGGVGAATDYLSHVVISPQSTSPGAVTVTDNATAIIIFPGGASSVSNLAPFTLFLGMTGGPWSLTTGLAVKAIGVGKFT